MTDTPPLVPSAERTALLLIDMQGFTVIHPMQPLSGQEVLVNAVRLADACRAAGILVVLVQAGGAIRLTPPVDMGYPEMRFPPDSHLIARELGPKPEDVVVTKYNLGAFYCTDLDAQLRRRGIDTILLGGMTTAFGVEGTARQAHERAYAQIFVSDAMAGFTVAEHENSLTISLPRLGRIRTTDQVLAALPAARST